MNKQNQKGITLIALIITIIVMLILVGVSVSVALNTGLFKTAGDTAKNTQKAADAETAISNGTINIEGHEGEISIDEYVESLKGEDGEEKVAITPKKENYTVGEAVTIGTEAFYVIADDAEKVTLLAKDNINTTTLVQEAGAGNVAFCSSTAWTGIAAGDNLNEKQSIKSEATSAVALAIEYGENLGGTGRLMTKSEAEALDTETYRDILNGTNGKSSSGYLNYWLGSAFGTNDVWYVSGYGSFVDYGFVSDYVYGVRPVVEILKSDI